MQSLKDNIETLERIEKDFDGSVDNYYNNTDIKKLLKSLSGGKYKLKQMGVPLVSEYLKVLEWTLLNQMFMFVEYSRD